jgi:hypothetical protein
MEPASIDDLRLLAEEMENPGTNFGSTFTKMFHQQLDRGQFENVEIRLASLLYHIIHHKPGYEAVRELFDDLYKEYVARKRAGARATARAVALAPAVPPPQFGDDFVKNTEKAILAGLEGDAKRRLKSLHDTIVKLNSGRGGGMEAVGLSEIYDPLEALFIKTFGRPPSFGARSNSRRSRSARSKSRSRSRSARSKSRSTRSARSKSRSRVRARSLRTRSAHKRH